MKHSWIWLPKDIYPQHQTTRFDALSGGNTDTFVVAEFKKIYSFNKKAASVSIRFSADTEAVLFCNDTLIATGPSAVGGDFMGNGKAREWYYADTATFEPYSSSLSFFVRVKMCPTRIYEYSKGHGGFMLSGKVTFDDGSSEAIGTDETWLVRKNAAYTEQCHYDGRISPDQYVSAEVIPDIWNAAVSPIPVRAEKEIPIGIITLAPGEETTKQFFLDMIYAGFLHVSSDGSGEIKADFSILETDENRPKCESVTMSGRDNYRSFQLQSVGNVTVTAKNLSSASISLKISLVTTFYPIEADAETSTSDDDVNKILNVCKHTLKYCRQTHHLDSARHCEPLACTGDYYIEALMTQFSFGDMRLAEFDVLRTAELLRHSDGRMFHTTYSLIWVRMLYDVYMISGNADLLVQCRDALDMLLARFDKYIGENGLVENPPDYMFVDWIYIDGLSMHHPPKALGQTVLNMFYFMALSHAEMIYRVLGEDSASMLCNKKKTALQAAINILLYDSEKGMYFEGLNTLIPEDQVNKWQPQNTQKRYYLKHSNIMAAYTSVCDHERAEMLIDKIMSNEIEGDIQPYFMHYLLEAIYTHDLRNKYTLQVIERWKKPIEDCDKGLAEGFVTPEPTYHFDHSHAWGGTPLHSIPKAITGLSVEEAGCKVLKFDPSLLSFEYASVEIPTAYGTVKCELKQGCSPNITAPDGVKILFRT